jgi:hypothetical protein
MRRFAAGRDRAAVVVASMAAAVMLCAPPASAADSAKQKDIRKLLELTGSGQIGLQVARQMVDSFRTSMPNVPAAFWDDFLKQARGEDLVDLVVPVYDRHLSHEDVKQLIVFYESPTGRKFVSVLPDITRDSMAAGQKWGEQLGQNVMRKLQEKGYK